MQKYHLVFLLFIPSFFACQQVEENTLSFTNCLAVASNTDRKETPKNVATNILFQSKDGGHSWQDISAGLPVDVKANGFFAGNGELYLRAENGIYSSNAVPNAPAWQKDAFEGKPGAALFLGRAGVLAATSGGRLFQKIKATNLWLPVGNDLKGRSMYSILEQSDGSLIAGCDNGIYKSTDAGKTWKQVYEDGWVIQMVESNGVLLCTNEGGILRSTDGGEHWNVVLSEGGVGIAVEVIEGGFAAITYNTKSETRRIRITTDGGTTWQPIDAELPPSANIASIKQMGKDFYCGHPNGIYRSTDGGKTWQMLLPSIGKKVFNLSISGNVIYALPQEGGC